VVGDGAERLAELLGQLHRTCDALVEAHEQAHAQGVAERLEKTRIDDVPRLSADLVHRRHRVAALIVLRPVSTPERT
jgi:hypothetical protein